MGEKSHFDLPTSLAFSKGIRLDNEKVLIMLGIVILVSLTH